MFHHLDYNLHSFYLEAIGNNDLATGIKTETHPSDLVFRVLKYSSLSKSLCVSTKRNGNVGESASGLVFTKRIS